MLIKYEVHYSCEECLIPEEPSILIYTKEEISYFCPLTVYMHVLHTNMARSHIEIEIDSFGKEFQLAISTESELALITLKEILNTFSEKFHLILKEMIVYYHP